MFGFGNRKQEEIIVNEALEALENIRVDTHWKLDNINEQAQQMIKQASQELERGEKPQNGKYR